MSDVRQSAFALVGDLAKASVAHLAPLAEPFIAAALRNLEPPLLCYANASACNNAAWALGELAVKMRPEQLSPYAGPIAERLAFILQPGNQMARSLMENAAIAIGRVAWVCPEPLAPHLAAFLGPWCAALRNLRDDVEKEHAFMGLCRLIRANPEAAAASFPAVGAAVASWHTVKCEGLVNEMSQCLQGLRQHLAANQRWDALAASMDMHLLEKLATMRCI